MRRKVTRRDFMKGAAIVAASGLLAGCSGGEGPAAPDNSEQPGTSEKPAESNSNSSSSSESESTSSSKPEETNGIKWIYSKNSDGTITLKGYDKTAEKVPSGELIIPKKYDGYTVSAVGYQCLYKNNDIESVVVPNCIQTIGQQAFCQCKNLTSVSLTDGLKKIETSAFSGCNLDGLTLPASLTKVGANAFAENISLTDAVILGKTEFDSGTFKGCKNLIAVCFKNSIRILPNEMFRECVKLQNVVLPTGLKTLGSYIFYGCSLLESIVLPDTLTDIGRYGFGCCKSLRSIEIPKGVTKISEWIFTECTNLNSVKLEETVKIVERGAFNNCSALATIKLPKTMSEIQSVAFWHCSGLQKIALPENISTISNQTFQFCVSLRDIYIPASVTKIESCAFDKCTSLNNVYFGGSKAKWDSVLISTGMPSYDTYNGNKYLTTDIMNRYWNQTAASIGY